MSCISFGHFDVAGVEYNLNKSVAVTAVILLQTLTPLPVVRVPRTANVFAGLFEM